MRQYKLKGRGGSANTASTATRSGETRRPRTRGAGHLSMTGDHLQTRAGNDRRQVEPVRRTVASVVLHLATRQQRRMDRLRR